ncbi:hypothetical protein [Agaribacter flavus]|uniref:Uncharacterized protein n=1 Tax=Agaribacter flavus TaxID=1902781 RepID=A0ABV7FQM4_9ALTE
MNSRNQSYRALSVIVLTSILFSCSSIRIDVDVYKGPLADQEKVQHEQLTSLTMTSKQILSDLEENLKRDLIYAERPFGAQFSLKSKRSRKHTDSPISHMDLINLNACEITKEPSIWENKGYASNVSLACSLTRLQGLFNDLAPTQISEYYGDVSQQFARIKALSANSQNTRNFNEYNKNIRKAHNYIILSSLRVIDYLHNLPADDRKTFKESDRINMLQSAAELVGTLINPNTLKQAIDEVDIYRGAKQTGYKSSFDSEYKDTLKSLQNFKTELKEIDDKYPNSRQEQQTNDKAIANQNRKKNATWKAYEKASNNIAKQLSLSDNTAFARSLLNTLNLAMAISQNGRINTSGIARGISVFKDLLDECNNGSTNTNDCSMDEVLKDPFNRLAQNTFASFTNAVVDLDVFNQTRNKLGLITLINHIDAGDGLGLVDNELALEKMLLNYAGKLLALADKKALTNEHITGTARKSLKQYVQVLQAIGTTIVVQINEIKRKRAHADKQEDWQQFDWTNIEKHFGLSAANFKDSVLISLKNDKAALSKREKALQALRGELKTWNENKASDLKQHAERLQELKSSLIGFQQASASLDTFTQALNMQNDPTTITFSAYLNEANNKVNQSINRIESALSKSGCTYIFGQNNSKCSEHRALQYTLSRANTLFINDGSNQARTYWTNFVNTALKEVTSAVAVQKKAVQTKHAQLQTESEELIGKIKTATGLSDISIEKIDALTKNMREKQQYTHKLIAHVDGVHLDDVDNIETWQEQLRTGLNTNEQQLVDKKVKWALNKALKHGFSCQQDEQDKSHSNNKVPAKHCDSSQALDGVIRHLEHLTILQKTQYPDGSAILLNTERALTSAYDLRARRQYLVPASAYLRSSYPSSSLQDDSGAENWDNMLVHNNLRAVPGLGELAFTRNNSTQQQIDKQYWQNINTVRVNGSNEVNYVIVKDDIGNWYVKSYSVDPKSMYRTLSNAVLFHTAGKAGSFLNAGEGILGLANSSNALDVLYASNIDKYQTSTLAQFQEIKSWLADKNWRISLDTLCNSHSGDINKAITSSESSLKTIASTVEDVKEDNFEAQATQITSFITLVVNYSNALIDELGADKKCGDQEKLTKKIHQLLYVDIAKKHFDKRNKSLNDYETKTLFISDAIPKTQQPELDLKEEEAIDFTVAEE